MKERFHREEWFDEECRATIKERNNARIRMLQLRTRITAEEFNNKRREASRVYRNTKKAFERKKFEKTESCHARGLVR